jgi:hypothetical protein
MLADSRANVETPDDLYALARQVEWPSLLLAQPRATSRSSSRSRQRSSGSSAYAESLRSLGIGGESSGAGNHADDAAADDGGMTLSVEAVLGQTGSALRHSHFCALTVKNAAVDACRDDPNNHQGRRPNVRSTCVYA